MIEYCGTLKHTFCLLLQLLVLNQELPFIFSFISTFLWMKHINLHPIHEYIFYAFVTEMKTLKCAPNLTHSTKRHREMLCTEVKNVFSTGIIVTRCLFWKTIPYFHPNMAFKFFLWGLFYKINDLIWFIVFNTTFSNIMATSFSGGRSWSNRREPPTMGKQLVNFITSGCESSAPFFVIYKAGREPTSYWW